jgi:hypothetical protein
MNPSAVPLPHEHVGHQHQHHHHHHHRRQSLNPPQRRVSLDSTPLSPHPFDYYWYRRRLPSPISPLSTNYTRSLNKTATEILAACDREVQWSYEMEYGETVEEHMLETEVTSCSLK